MHRLFVAIRPPLAIRRACLDAMADGPPGWAWQDDEQLHVTLRYIGEVERRLAEDIAAVLGTIHAAPVEIGISGVGLFDQRSRGALFARAIPREPLATLHKKVDRALVSAGLKPEARSYLPHITLARRRRSAVDPSAWLERKAGLATPPERVTHLTLFESCLGREGARYDVVERFPLD